MRLFKMKKIAGALALVALSSTAMAAPVNGVFTNGVGAINQVGTDTNVAVDTQYNTITWDSFNVAGNEAVNFSKTIGSNVQIINIDNQGVASNVLGAINADAGIQAILVNPDGINVNGATINGDMSFVVGSVSSSNNQDDYNNASYGGSHFSYVLASNPLTVTDTTITNSIEQSVIAGGDITITNSAINSQLKVDGSAVVLDSTNITTDDLDINADSLAIQNNSNLDVERTSYTSHADIAVTNAITVNDSTVDLDVVGANTLTATNSNYEAESTYITDSLVFDNVTFTDNSTLTNVGLGAGNQVLIKNSNGNFSGSIFGQNVEFRNSNLSSSNSFFNVSADNFNMIDSSIIDTNSTALNASSYLSGSANISMIRSSIDADSGMVVGDGNGSVSIADNSQLASDKVALNGSSINVSDSVINADKTSSSYAGDGLNMTSTVGDITLNNMSIDTDNLLVVNSANNVSADNVNVTFTSLVGDSSSSTSGLAFDGSNTTLTGSTILLNGGINSTSTVTDLPLNTDNSAVNSDSNRRVTANNGASAITITNSTINDGTLAPVTPVAPPVTVEPIPIIPDSVANPNVTVMRIELSNDIDAAQIEGDTIMIPSYQEEASVVDTSEIFTESNIIDKD